MNENFYRRNHYVPRWYQKRFLQPEHDSKFFYLDLKPDTILANRQKIKRTEVLRWGTKKCFVKEDLYTTNFGDLPNTEIEQYFFGNIDAAGREATKYFDSFAHPDAHPEAFNNLVQFMSVQKLRTIKGLAVLNTLVGGDKNQNLIALQRLQNIYVATWSECVWQIVSAEKSDTKFIASDHPITVYNRKCPPGTQHSSIINDPDIRLVGTHTIFPLSLNKALILTNLSWVRNPFCDPTKLRPNSGLFRQTVFSFLDIHLGRELTEVEVNEINFIIKRRAHRYVAAAKEEWLYPERVLKNIGWYSLGGGDLLMPDPRSMAFHTQTMIGYENGAAEAYDPYGRSPQQKDFGNRELEMHEMRSFQGAQGLFAKRHGPKRRGRTHSMGGRDILEDSPDMHQHYLGMIRFLPKAKR